MGGDNGRPERNTQEELDSLPDVIGSVKCKIAKL
jgi:hypothetical protein